MSQDYGKWTAFEGRNIPSSLELCGDIYEVIEADDRVIDLGCGYGKTCVELYGRAFKNITGVDINRSGIEYARSSVPPGAITLNFRVEDVTRLSFPASSFTGGIMQALLTAIPDRKDRAKVFSEAARVLAPGGWLYIACFCQTWHAQRYRERYLTAMAEGYEEGTFPVYHATTGALEYVAHHHSERELVDLLLEANFAIERFRFDQFTTRSGHAINGMVVISRNQKASV